MEQFLTPEFLVAVGQIVMIDILLGGDNAVVIALACRKLPARQRKLTWRHTDVNPQGYGKYL